MTEWPKCETCHLEQLKSERDADDRDAIQQSNDCIIKADDKSAKEQPKYVSYKFHICKDNDFQHRVQKHRETARDTLEFRGIAGGSALKLHSIKFLSHHILAFVRNRSLAEYHLGTFLLLTIEWSGRILFHPHLSTYLGNL